MLLELAARGMNKVVEFCSSEGLVRAWREEVVWMCERAGLTDASRSVAFIQHRQGREMLAQNSRAAQCICLLSSGAALYQPQSHPSLPELTINPCVETAPSAWPTAHLPPFEELSRSIVLSWEAATQSNCGKGPA